MEMKFDKVPIHDGLFGIKQILEEKMIGYCVRTEKGWKWVRNYFFSDYFNDKEDCQRDLVSEWFQDGLDNKAISMGTYYKDEFTKGRRF